VDIFIGQTKRFKFEYSDHRTGVNDLHLTLRDSGDVVVYGPVTMTEFASGGVYHADWTPSSVGNYTLYIESVTNPIGQRAHDINVIQDRLAELWRLAGLDPSSPVFIPAGEGTISATGFDIAVTGDCSTGHTLTR